MLFGVKKDTLFEVELASDKKGQNNKVLSEVEETSNTVEQKILKACLKP